VPLHLPGRHHGAGRQEAIDNTREMAEAWLEQVQANGQDIGHAEVLVDALHQPLFGREPSCSPLDPGSPRPPAVPARG
jgi:hypothetical protein